MLENVRLAFQGVWSHKMRSMLTMLGIIIGIASIITIVSTIKGTNEQIKENLIGAGNNVVLVQLNQNGYTFDATYYSIPTCVRPITEQTRQQLEQIDGAEKATIFYSRSYSESVYYQNISYSGAVYGVDENYFSVYGYQVKMGRGFTDADYQNCRKVAIVDENVISALSLGKNPVGQALEIQEEVYTIVGVVAMSEDFSPTISSMTDYNTYVGDSSGCIYIPDSTWPTSYRFDEPRSAAIKVASTDELTTVGQEAAEILTENQIIGEDTGYDYRSEDLLEQAQNLQEMSESTNTQLIWIASISLLVGGIGVMNIMLVSVTERTSEIGLKKAIGAKKRRILMQFLTEAAVLTSLGGVIGVATGIGLAELISRLTQIPVAISVPAIAISVIFSTLIGVIFGLLPATKAANLNPIEALRRV